MEARWYIIEKLLSDYKKNQHSMLELFTKVRQKKFVGFKSKRNFGFVSK